MARYTVKIEVDGTRLESVRKKVKEAFGDEAAAQVAKVKVAASRGDRLVAVGDTVEEARGEVEALRDELQEWHDNLPENLQDGAKASEIDDAIGELDNLVQEMEGLDFSSVSFPGMY